MRVFSLYHPGLLYCARRSPACCLVMFGRKAARSPEGLEASDGRGTRPTSFGACVECVEGVSRVCFEFEWFECVESVFGVRHDQRWRRRVPQPSEASRPSGSTCAIRPNKQSGRFRRAWMIEATTFQHRQILVVSHRRKQPRRPRSRAVLRGLGVAALSVA